jgi:hypothetical protein
VISDRGSDVDADGPSPDVSRPDVQPDARDGGPD